MLQFTQTNKLEFDKLAKLYFAYGNSRQNWAPSKLLVSYYSNYYSSNVSPFSHQPAFRFTKFSNLRWHFVYSSRNACNSPIHGSILEKVFVVDLKDRLREDLRTEVEEFVFLEWYVVFNPNGVFFALLIPGLKLGDGLEQNTQISISERRTATKNGANRKRITQKALRFFAVENDSFRMTREALVALTCREYR